MEKSVDFFQFGYYSEKNQDRHLTGFDVSKGEELVHIRPWNTSGASTSCSISIPKRHVQGFIKALIEGSGLQLNVDTNVIGGHFNWDDVENRLSENGLEGQLDESDIQLLDTIANKMSDMNSGIHWEALDCWIEEAIKIKNQK